RRARRPARDDPRRPALPVEAVLEGVASELLAARVGAVSLAVLGAAIVFFVFVYSRIEWGVRDRVRVYFHRTGGLREGAPLVVAGRAIGHIESIALATREPMLHG